MIEKNVIGIIGILIALAAIGVAIFQDGLRPPPEPAATRIRQQAISKGAQILGIKLEQSKQMDWVMATQYSLGFIAIILGVFSWVRKENHRISAVAASLGIVAIAWEYVLMAVGFAVLIMILDSFSWAPRFNGV